MAQWGLGGQGTRPACAPPTPGGSHGCPLTSERVLPACGRHPGPWRCHSPVPGWLGQLRPREAAEQWPGPEPGSNPRQMMAPPVETGRSERHASPAPRGVCAQTGGARVPHAESSVAQAQRRVRDPGPQGGAGPHVAPRGPRGRARAGRAPHSGLAASSAPDTLALSGEQDQPGGPGRERAGRLHGSQGHAPQGRGSTGPAGSRPRARCSSGPGGDMSGQRPEATLAGTPGPLRLSRQKVAVWAAGQRPEGTPSGPSGFRCQEGVYFPQGLVGGKGPWKLPGGPGEALPGFPGSRGDAGPLLSRPCPRGWRWAGGAQGVLTSCPSPRAGGGQHQQVLDHAGEGHLCAGRNGERLRVPGAGPAGGACVRGAGCLSQPLWRRSWGSKESPEMLGACHGAQME